jgi:hypothetical protein
LGALAVWMKKSGDFVSKTSLLIFYTRKCIESKKYINRIKYNDRKPKRIYNIAKERIRDKGKSDK